MQNKKPLPQQFELLTHSRDVTAEQQKGRDECGSEEEKQMKHKVCTETEEEDGSSTYERASWNDSSSSSSDQLIRPKSDFHLQPNKCQVPVCARQRRFNLWLNTPHIIDAFHNMSGTMDETRALPRADLKNEGAKGTTTNQPAPKLLPKSLWARHVTSKMLQEKHTEPVIGYDYIDGTDLLPNVSIFLYRVLHFSGFFRSYSNTQCDSNRLLFSKQISENFTLEQSSRPTDINIPEAMLLMWLKKTFCGFNRHKKVKGSSIQMLPLIKYIFINLIAYYDANG